MLRSFVRFRPLAQHAQNLYMPRMAPLIQRRFLYNEEALGGFEHVLGIYDQNNDKVLQFEEFDAMAKSFGISAGHYNMMKDKYFPVMDEEYAGREFGTIFTQLFDENMDGILQYEEFLKMKPLLNRANFRRLQQQFFPTRSEELHMKEQSYTFLMTELKTHVGAGVHAGR